VKALAREGVVRVPGGWTTPSDRILALIDWLPIFLPSFLLIALLVAGPGLFVVTFDYVHSFRS